ncbi:MAG: c-type cytochrome [Halothiobacillaceae bacterium]
MKIRQTLTAAVVGLVLAGGAQAADQERAAAEPWTPGTWMNALQAMPDGDVRRGENIHTEMFCASCHGARGESVSDNWPALNGQRAEYSYKMLLDYKDGRRHEDERADIMIEVAQFLTEQDMADLAAFYADQPLPEPRERTMDAEQFEQVDKLVRQGDPTRLLTPCAACHGAKGEGGINETPALAGQVPDYFIRTMKAYRDGLRTNDVNKGMSQFAKPLTDEEIRLLAEYYASMPMAE